MASLVVALVILCTLLMAAQDAIAAVDLFTGLYVRQADDIVLDGTPPIRLTRAYRTRDPRSRAFGIGTNHSYDWFLVGDAAGFHGPTSFSTTGPASIT